MKARRLKRKQNVTNTSIDYKKTITGKKEMSKSNTLKYRKKSILEQLLKKQQDMNNYTMRGNLRDKTE